jgi:hypothetical protein
VPSRRLSCCFCGERTGDNLETDYVELAARFPEIDSSMIQFFGAHASCFDRVNAHGYQLERPLVEEDEFFDDDELGGPALDQPALEPAPEPEPPVHSIAGSAIPADERTTDPVGQQAVPPPPAGG